MHKFEPRLSDLVGMLQYHVREAYAGAARGSTAEVRTLAAVEFLSRSGLIQKRASSGAAVWSETKLLSRDFRESLAKKSLAPRVGIANADQPFSKLISSIGALDAMANNIWVYHHLAMRLGCSLNYEAVAGSKEVTSYGQAFRRVFRGLYGQTVRLVANLWELKDLQKVVRRPTWYGAEWAPAPSEFFEHLNLYDCDSHALLLKTLQEKQLMKRRYCPRCLRHEWSATRAGVRAGLTSKSRHLLAVLDAVGVDINDY